MGNYITKKNLCPPLLNYNSKLDPPVLTRTQESDFPIPFTLVTYLYTDNIDYINDENYIDDQLPYHLISILD